MADSEKLLSRAKSLFSTSIDLKREFVDKNLSQVVEAALLIVDSFKSGGKLMICGNGGSAADAQHLAGEFTCRLSKELEREALPALALTCDTSFLTAYCNDYNFEGIFARQVEALGKKEDVLLGISTSGSSKNVIKAFEYAKSKGIRTIALCGKGEGLKHLSTVSINVPSFDTNRVQESHICIEHIICDLVERILFAKI